MEIVIDETLEALLFSLSAEEKDGLEASILTEGCREPLIIWKNKNILVDGHNRFDICTRHGVEYLVTEREFQSLDDVKDWMIENQLSRRNLHPDQASYLRGCLYRNAKKEQGGDRNPYGAKGKPAESSCQNDNLIQGEHPPESDKTEEAIAKRTGVSTRTVHRDAKFSNAIDRIEETLDTNIKGQLDHFPRKDWVYMADEMEDHQDAIAHVIESAMESKTKGKEALRDFNKQKRQPLEVVAEAPTRVVAVESGDVWMLGGHVLYCGDSSAMKDTFPKATMAFADPPYNVDVAEWDRGFLWDHDWLQDLATFVLVTPGVSAFQSFFALTQMRYRWALSCGLPGVYGRHSAIGTSNALPVLLFSNAQSVHLGINDYTTITYNQSEKTESNHPGRKPKALLGWLIDSFTNKGDIILDPFLGSGTTLLMAEQMNRFCYGCEISPEYCQQAIARWEMQTGQQARHVSPGAIAS